MIPIIKLIRVGNYRSNFSLRPLNKMCSLLFYFHCVKMGHMMTLLNHSEEKAAHYSLFRASYQQFICPFRLVHISTVFLPVQYVYFSPRVLCSSMLCTLRAAVGQCVDVSRCILKRNLPHPDDIRERKKGTGLRRRRSLKRRQRKSSCFTPIWTIMK